jgi:molecular chaperone DnaK
MDRTRCALADAEKTPQQIKEVVLVGGSTHIPLVQETVKKFFGKEPHKGVNPDEVVAVGAAMQAGVLTGEVKDLVVLDATALSLGIETQPFQGHDLERAGVETLGSVMTLIIPRNTSIPTRKKEVFSTQTDNQPSIEIHVLQGERTEARFNRTLGRFHLEGIMQAPRRVPMIEVTFDIDANGILSVHAKDMATGKDQKITITANSGMADADIQRMVKEAAEHESEDKERREQIERRNKLDNLCYTLEKMMSENKDKLQAADVTTLEGLIKDGRSAVEKQDDGLVKDALEKLEKEAHRLAGAMYQGAAGGDGANGGGPGVGGDGAPPAGGEGKKKDGGVIDAEFEETST